MTLLQGFLEKKIDRGEKIAEQEVARIAKEMTGSFSTIADINQGPKSQILTAKLKSLGIVLGGEALLRKTVGELAQAHRS